MALRGTEVKSIREGQANLKDSYGLIKDGEAFLLNVHIGPYSHGNMANHDALRLSLIHISRFRICCSTLIGASYYLTTTETCAPCA